MTLRRLLNHSAGFTVHGFPGYEAGTPIPTLVEVLDGKKPGKYHTYPEMAAAGSFSRTGKSNSASRLSPRDR